VVGAWIIVVAIADLAAAMMPTTANDAWVKSCVDRIEIARKQLVAKRPRLDGTHVEDHSMSFETADCSVERGTLYELKVGGAKLSFGVWGRDGKQLFDRNTCGYNVQILGDDPDSDLIVATFTPPLEQCLKLAPALIVHKPRTGPSDRDIEARCRQARNRPLCIAAREGARTLDGLCSVQGDVVGHSARPGKTSPALASILAWRAGARLLSQLARSPNAAARYVAADGFAWLSDADSRRELQRPRSTAAPQCCSRDAPATQRASANTRRR
jgi:hypothetical protein